VKHLAPIKGTHVCQRQFHGKQDEYHSNDNLASIYMQNPTADFCYVQRRDTVTGTRERKSGPRRNDGLRPQALRNLIDSLVGGRGLAGYLSCLSRFICRPTDPVATNQL
jgi:hypothetical protein